MVELEELAKNEDASWRQKSRALWLQQGDQNTRFFHRMATAHKRYNTIDRLVIGGEVVQAIDIQNDMVEFYEKFTPEQKYGGHLLTIARVPR